VTGTSSGTARHVAVLILLVRVWGALSALVGVSMLLLAFGALSILFDPDWPSEALGTGITVGAFVAVFGLLGAGATAWGAAHLWAGRLLGRQQYFGRVLTLALGVVDLLVLPLGTALGAYALWVLMSHQARQMFGAARGDTLR
jgi:nitrate reductase gamma subunit